MNKLLSQRDKDSLRSYLTEVAEECYSSQSYQSEGKKIDRLFDRITNGHMTVAQFRRNMKEALREVADIRSVDHNIFDVQTSLTREQMEAYLKGVLKAWDLAGCFYESPYFDIAREIGEYGPTGILEIEFYNIDVRDGSAAANEEDLT